MNIVVLGSLNMDMVILTDILPKQGETVVGKSFYTSHGGKGANQALAIGKMGIKPLFIGCVGNDNYGREMLKSLADSNVDVSQVQEINAPTGVAMITIHNDDNRIILSAGANELVDKHQILSALSFLDEKSFFLTQFENNIDAIEYGLCVAKSRGMYTVLNPAPFKKVNREVYKNLDLIVLNKTECESLVNFKIDTEEAIKNAFNYITDLGVKHIVLTLGSEGSILYENKQIHKIKAYKTNVLDTTCAGDSYIGAMLSQLAKKHSYQEACDFAAQVASITVSKKGAQASIPSYKTMKELNNILIRN